MEQLTIVNKNMAVVRREILTKVELIKCLNGQEFEIYKASTERTLAEYSHTELAKVLVGKLSDIAYDVGYKMADDKLWTVNVARIIKYLHKYYSGLSVHDIELAFELLVVGELDEYLPKTNGQPDRAHYQQFNADYFFKILNAYNKRRSDVISKVTAIMPDDEVKNAIARKREIERAGRYTKANCINAYLEYKYRGKLNGNSLEVMLYCRTLSECGLMAENVRVGEDERKELLEVMGKRNKVGRYGELRKRKLKEVFDWMISEEIQIRDYVNINPA